MVKRTNRGRPPAGGREGGFEGILRGLGGLVEKLAELAEAGGELSRTAQFRVPGAPREVKGIYGFTVKVGLGGEGIKVEPFGNIRADAASGRPVVEESREPAVDVFEEGDHALVVAEMPGIAAEDVRLEVRGDVLTITAGRADRKYRKEVRLPGTYPREKMRVSCTNGILEIRCVR